jgi:hypothetical protein
VFSPRVRIGDIKPLGPIWPQRSIDKIKRKDNEPGREDERRDKHPQNEDDDKGGHVVDEYA